MKKSSRQNPLLTDVNQAFWSVFSVDILENVLTPKA